MSKGISPAEADFWLDTDKYANFFEEQLDPNKGLVFSIDMVRLSSIRKAISNFVRILTRKNIPVYFNDMDANVNFGGKIIYISAKILNKQDFDVAVGQALHEAAHTLKTDFDTVKLAWTNIPHKIFQLSDSKGIRRASLEKFIHTTWNVIEDRYIDDYVFNSAPGYRGYYVSLYDRFWHCPEVDENLLSDKFRYPSLDSYMFRIINFTNDNTDLLALPRLDEIADVIDIENISRLKTTQDRVKTAFEVVEIVLNCLDVNPPQAGKGTPNKGKGKNLARPEDFFDFDGEEGEGDPQESDGSGKESTPSESPQEEKEVGNNPKDESKDVDVGKQMVEEISDVMSGRDQTPEILKENKDVVNKVSEDELSDGEVKEIKNMVEQQRKFLLGELPKEVVTPEQKQLLDLIEKHGILLVKVDAPTLLAGDDKNLKVDCIVVQKMTKELILAGQEVFPLCGVMKLGNETPDPPKENAEAVKKGIVLGTKLGRKLQIRNEINPTKTIRKKWGKIHRRQLHEAAFDAEDLFYKITIDEHQKATLHITVDASGSMSRGNKWTQTMIAVVAICKAASMIDNVHVTVSFRSTQNVGMTCLPHIILAYDSKVDKFSKVRNLFPYLSPNGYTPEGLAFSAIMNLFENITPDETDRYFLNLSDGEPCYAIKVASTGMHISYQDEVGVTHTKGQVDKIRRHGIEILSYFIDEDYEGPLGKVNKETKPADIAKAKETQKELDETPLRKNFRKMYGKNAQFINVESIVDLARTINRLFLTKQNEKRT